LQKQIERYARERHEPLLSGTGRIFAQLTGGRFAGVLPGRGAKDQPILVGERADGSSLPVEKMSQGTRDQLFLSLRLATLEHWIERKGAFPLVVDDLCVHFDDQRAGAALEVLAGLGQRSQVLYFTHLQRDLDLGDRLAARGLATCHRM
jgi:uncharacterized protein YhaN